MEKLYTFKEVVAFGLIGLNNLLHSANKEDINLKNFEMFLEPLEKIYKKEDVVNYANYLKNV